MTAVVRTVLGDLRPVDLGPTDYHEHLFQASPLLPDETLDDEQASGTEAAALAGSGAAAMVEATPIGLGRDPAAVARISRRSGLHIVHTTGVHRHEHYAPGTPLLTLPEDDLHRLLREELLVGMDGTGIRAGLVKAGVGLWSIDPFERRALTVAARLAAEFGTPLMVHLEHGTAAHEVLDLLAAHSCPADRVALAHVDRNPDPVLHAELAARGAYLGYDGAARYQRWPDSVLIECLERTVATAGTARILLGGDVARRSRYLAYGGMPGLSYLFERFVPRVRAALGSQAVDQVLRTNPARWLAWEAP